MGLKKESKLRIVTSVATRNTEQQRIGISDAFLFIETLRDLQLLNPFSSIRSTEKITDRQSDREINVLQPARSDTRASKKVSVLQTRANV